MRTLPYELCDVFTDRPLAGSFRACVGGDLVRSESEAHAIGSMPCPAG